MNSTVKLQNSITVNLSGAQPMAGTIAPNFTAVTQDLQNVSLSDYKGKKVVLNIFPSIDTGVCAASVRRFNQEAASRPDTVVLGISMDLPFAQGRFCGAEGIDNVVMLSTFRDTAFQEAYGLLMQDGPLAGLLARAVFVLDAQGTILYNELVPEITQEPNYKAALAAL